MVDSIKAISRWATSFKIALLLSLATTISLHAGKLPGADEAVRQLLPKASYERETLLLTQTEQLACEKSANQEDVRALVTRYVARNDSGVTGYAYLDKHQVRTLPQTLMVVVDAEGRLVGIKVLAFREPAEYMSREGWMEQFRGKTVRDQILMKKNIDGITGATLTARAVTQCARRVLAVHQVLEQREKK